MARPKSKTEEELLENRKNNQEDFTKKRRLSGLTQIKVYLDASTLEALTKLSAEYGYDAPRTRRAYENRSEVLTNIIGYCVRKAAGCDKGKLPESTLDPCIAQSVFSIIQIVKYRKMAVGESNHRIAQFMNKYSYPKPSNLAAKDSSTQDSKGWSSMDVEYALDSKKIRRLLNPK